MTSIEHRNAVALLILTRLAELGETITNEDHALCTEIAQVVATDKVDTIKVELVSDVVQISFSVEEPADSNVLVAPFLEALASVGYTPQIETPIINPIKVNRVMNKPTLRMPGHPTALASALEGAGLVTATEAQLEATLAQGNRLDEAAAAIDAAAASARQALSGYDENVLPVQPEAPAAKSEAAPVAQTLQTAPIDTSGFASASQARAENATRQAAAPVATLEEEKSFFQRLELTTPQKVAIGVVGVVVVGAIAYYGAQHLGYLGGGDAAAV